MTYALYQQWLLYICGGLLAVVSAFFAVRFFVYRIVPIIDWIKTHRLQSIFLAPAVIVMILHGGGKINATWGTGLYNNGSYTTNDTQAVFHWTKSATINDSEIIYFAAKHKDYPDLDWEEIGSTAAGTLTYTYNWTSGYATNYNYYVFVLPQVHTNGVWLGNVLSKTIQNLGKQNETTNGVDKMVIIRGAIFEDGEQIAPDYPQTPSVNGDIYE